MQMPTNRLVPYLNLMLLFAAAQSMFALEARSEEPSGQEVVATENAASPQTKQSEGQQYKALPFWSDEFVQHDWRIQRNVITNDFRLLDDRDQVRLEGDFEACRTCYQQFSQDSQLLPVKGKVVILLHGLFRDHRAGKPLQRELSKHEYTTIRVGYASTQAGIDSHAAALAKIVENLPDATEINFVGHSMGNIVIRKYLSDALRTNHNKLDPRFGRFVMLGPPNQGSAIALAAGDSSFLNRVVGTGFAQLGSQWQEFMQTLDPLPLEYGIIAGNTAKNSEGNPLLAGPDDLVVRVEETKLAGARDFEVLPVVHMRMFSDSTVQQHTLNFLEHGYFVSAEERHPLEAAELPPQPAESTPHEE